MYPVLFRIGGLEITSFGALVALGVFVGSAVLSNEAKRGGLDAAAALEAVFVGVIGGLVGAKALYVAEHVWLGEPARGLIFDRAGLSWFGGLAVGIACALAVFAVRRVPWPPALDAVAPAVALGQAIGRVGCFLVGDDYGTPTALPWGLGFPNGSPPTVVPVHPTQLYEAAALVALFVWLRRVARRGARPGRVFARYLLGAGAIRFAIEFIRPNARLVAGLSIAQAFAAFAIVIGATWLGIARSRHATPAASRG